MRTFIMMIVGGCLFGAPTAAFAQTASERLTTLVEVVAKDSEFHANDRWPSGIMTSRTCGETDECPKGLQSSAIASIVRNQKAAGSWVVQEVHLYIFDSAKDADKWLVLANDQAFGPYQKHPFIALRSAPNVVVTVEGRFRFGKYLKRLAVVVQTAISASATTPN